MIKVKCSLNLSGTKTGRPRGRSAGEQPSAPPAPRIPRIARLMALAIRYDKKLRAGEITDAATLAMLSHVTQPRMTQILSLTLLAPDIQEELLHLPAAESVREPIHEKVLRSIVAETDWNYQRTIWQRLNSTSASARVTRRK